MKTLSILTMAFFILGGVVSGQNSNLMMKGGNNTPPSLETYQLLSFTAKKQSNYGYYCALLTWSAVGETQITGYDVEKSIDLTGIWSVIDYFPTSNSNLTITRTKLDYLVEQNKQTTFFYRLKIYFTDGRIQYSKIVSVSIGGGGGHTITWP